MARSANDFSGGLKYRQTTATLNSSDYIGSVPVRLVGVYVSCITIATTVTIHDAATASGSVVAVLLCPVGDTVSYYFGLPGLVLSTGLSITDGGEGAAQITVVYMED
jgi:hypothetical protein